MSVETRIEEMLTAPLGDLGLSIVRVQVSGSQRKVLEIMIERLDGEAVKIQDCVRASRETSAFLDVEDPIHGAYTLEVTSPGLDRPLVKRGDYKRFEGCEIKLETYVTKNGKKRYTGMLHDVTDEEFWLSTTDDKESAEVKFEYADVKKARLVPDLDF